MFRKLIIAIAALAASACSYGSAVDIAPMNARLPKPAAAPGDYCEVQGAKAPFHVVSHEDCAPVTWDQATRTYTLIDTDKPDESIQAALVSLGGGLYIASVDMPDTRPNSSRGPGDRYQFMTLISKGNAFAMLSALDDEPLKKLAAKYKKLTFANDRTGRAYIASGKANDIKDFLRAAAKESLRLAKAEGDADDISIGILDKAGAPDHPASKQQTEDIEAVLRIARSMTPR